MKRFAYKMPLDHIDQGGADDTARRLIEIWRETGGRLTSDFIDFHDVLVVTTPIAAESASPQVITAGDGALATHILGNGWSEIQGDIFDKDYKRLVSEGYTSATEKHQPVFDLISTDICSKQLKTQTLKYQRLLLPLSTDAGATFLFCYSMSAGSAFRTVQRSADTLPLPTILRNINRADPFALAASAR